MSRVKQAPIPPTDVNMDNVSAAGTASGLGEGFSQLQLKSKEIFCDYLESEMLHRKGCILQYVNLNSIGATNMIGATRINVTDARKVPMYLWKNKMMIRQHAVLSLQQHLLETQCSTGVTEVLTVEDYSLSFSWASITEEGRSLNPFGRSELPLAFAAFNKLVAPRPVSSDDKEGSLVVNVFIMLQEPAKRRGAVLKRSREDDIARNEMKKARFQHRQAVQTEDIVAKNADAIVQAFKRQAPLPTATNYPQLPVGAPSEWNKTGRTQLPSE
jgi:hypothetical protein